MTAQIPDRLTWAGAEYFLDSEPLESFFDIWPPRPNFAEWGLSTCCWRGYVGEWEIRAQRLYLKELRPVTRRRCTSLLNIVFPHTPPPIPAIWYTGELRLLSGNLVEYVHAGYASTYEREDILFMKRGILVNDNKHKFL